MTQVWEVLSLDLEQYRYHSFWYQDTACKASQKFTGSHCLNNVAKDAAGLHDSEVTKDCFPGNREG